MVTITSTTLDKIRISDHPELDRRRKLTDKQRLNILYEWWGIHEAERPTMTALGEKYGVHRTVIARVLYPERSALDREKQKLRAKDGRYYDRETSQKNLKNCREYKRLLIQEGKLKA